MAEARLRRPLTYRARGYMSKTVKVTDESFQSDVIDAAGPVLVDFWAEWCGPCRQIAPTLDELAKDYEGRLTVVKVNIDENPIIPSRFGVRGIPTLLMFKDGNVAATKIGALARSQLYSWVEGNI
ncbi:MAG: thioredoxin TrxA [Rhodospirillaceae bacterium]